MKTYTDIPSYIKSFPKTVQPVLEKLRQTIQKTVPPAGQKISYGIPTFTLDGNLVHFGAYPNHIGFYPGAAAIVAFKKELAQYKTSKGTVQFPITKPLPFPLIIKIVRFCVAAKKPRSA